MLQYDINVDPGYSGREIVFDDQVWIEINNLHNLLHLQNLRQLFDLMIPPFLLPLLLCMYISFPAGAQNTHSIIPQPVSVHLLEERFHFNRKVTITWSNGEDSVTANSLKKILAQRYGVESKINATSTDHQHIILLHRVFTDDLPPEGYKLTINETGITIAAPDGAGIFYGMQTLLQLITKEEANSGYSAPCAFVTDYPRYKWRGMHLDVARHFFTKEEVKQYLDYLAAYKFNTFHWHLTDDQGWRIEIKKYPLLTGIGAWRSGTLIGHYTDHPSYDSIFYGGYYTQDEVKEIVAYAAKLHITVVPEIEMPGHVQALLAAYPHLACTGDSFEVGKYWGVYNNVLCPTDESVIFMKDVLKEVMELFPSEYIHIGGDECPKDQWEKSDYCQNKIRQLGLKDETALQGYFTRQIDSFVSKCGRRIIGWDEILEGGLLPNALVMSWQGMKGGLDAANAGHEVVMSPTEYCYFDYYQSTSSSEPLAIGGYIPLEKVYAFEPTPASLAPDKQHLILGGQANVWTEYISGFPKLQYMIFPRMCAMSEVLWTKRVQRDYNSFAKRLTGYHFEWWNNSGIQYSKALTDVKFKVGKSSSNNILELELYTDISGTEISYYFGENESKPIVLKPDFKKSPIIIPINNSGVLHAMSKSLSGSKGAELVQPFNINLATGKAISLVHPPDQRYNNGGAFSLINGISAKLPWNGNEWLGFSGTNMQARIDLGKIESVSLVSLGLLKAESSWIYLPGEVKVELSEDGLNFTVAGRKSTLEIEKEGGRKAAISFPKTRAQFVRITAVNLGTIPNGKPGSGHPAWLFADEIVIE